MEAEQIVNSNPAIKTKAENEDATKTEAALLSLKNLVKDASISPVNNMKPINVNVSINSNDPRKIEIEPEELENEIKKQEIQRLKRYANQYVERKTFNAKYNLALKNNPMLYGGICAPASKEFLENAKRLLQENKFAFCMNPRAFYSNIIKFTVDNLKKKSHLDNGLPSQLIDLIGKNESIISLLIALLTLPILPFCVTGAPQAVMILFEILTVIIDLIMGELCSMNVISYKLIIKKALSELSNKFKSLYSTKAIRDVRERAKESFAKFKKMRDKLRLTLSESDVGRAFSEGSRRLSKRARNSYNYIKSKFTKKKLNTNTMANQLVQSNTIPVSPDLPPVLSNAPVLPGPPPVLPNAAVLPGPQAGGKRRKTKKYRR
jgi:hypothetical protein